MNWMVEHGDRTAFRTVGTRTVVMLCHIILRA